MKKNGLSLWNLAIIYQIPNRIISAIFIDFTLKYNKNKQFRFNLYAKNVLNEVKFTHLETSDYSLVFNQNKIVPRNFLFHFSCNFLVFVKIQHLLFILLQLGDKSL